MGNYQSNYYQPKFNQTVVSHVDLSKYQGLWYEVARKATFFESNKAKNITAEYTLINDGNYYMEIVNSEEVDGKIETIKGRAFVENEKTNSQLLIDFENVPVLGQYWIVRLVVDEKGDYSLAVVSTDGGKYLWILSRTKLCPNLHFIINDLRREGYNVDGLIFPEQE